MATEAESGGAGRTALDETDVKGAFKRVNSVWRNHIEEGGEFSPASGRYHLYVALACPWADGTLAALFMKGLEDCIGYSIVHPTWQRSRPKDPADQHHGWIFCKPGDPPLSNGLGFGNFECDDALVPDTVNGAKFIRDIYEKAGDTGGKYSTPVLWDKEKNTIVNNESMDILRMFNSKFNTWAKNPDLDLFPADLEAEVWLCKEPGSLRPSRQGPGRCLGQSGGAPGKAALRLQAIQLYGPETLHDLSAFRCRVRGVLQDQCGHHRDELSKFVGVL